MEILVSLTVFAVVTTIAVGAFTSVLRGQRHALATQAVQDNASVLIESMAREMRTGTEFKIPGPKIIPGSPGTHGTAFEFTNARGETVEYDLDGTILTREVIASIPQQISSNQIEITNFRFVVQGAAGGDGLQPMVTIIARFQSTGIKLEEQVVIDVSTSISQRELDS